MRIPQKINFINTPTPIQPLNIINPDKNWACLYIKRDDFTGFEMSGNKVRKYEYHLKYAWDQCSNVLITCGGIQSNHARATSALAAKFSLKCHLVLKGPDVPTDGNYFFDRLLGAEITIVSPEEYNNNRNEIMAQIGENYLQQGYRPYIMPVGGSNGIGMFGNYNAYYEILKQEQIMGIRFDSICVADGSGGTYGGLYAANELSGCGKNIIGFNIKYLSKL